jgi:hypothetical protein
LGWQETTSFPEEIPRGWLDHNWGLLLGHEWRPGKYLHAIDVDFDDGAGEYWYSLQRAFGSLDGSLTTRTRDGFHVYLLLPFRLERDIWLERGLTLKKAGRNVVAAGSVHPDPDSHGFPVIYRFETVDEPLEIPDAWLDYIKIRWDIRPPSNYSGSYDGESNFVPDIIEAGSQDVELMREGCRWRRYGYSRPEIQSFLEISFGTRYEPFQSNYKRPYSNKDFYRIANSVVRYDPEKPHVAERSRRAIKTLYRFPKNRNARKICGREVRRWLTTNYTVDEARIFLTSQFDFHCGRDLPTADVISEIVDRVRDELIQGRKSGNEKEGKR